MGPALILTGFAWVHAGPARRGTWGRRNFLLGRKAEKTLTNRFFCSILIGNLKNGGTMRNLDEIDVKILNMLKKNARTPLKELSAEVFLTTPAVSSRMEKLEREGYIKGYHAALNMEKLGYGIKAFIMITVEPEDSKRFCEFIREQKCVLECDHITGPYSMIMQVVFPSTTLLDEFLGKLQVFGKTETQVVFSNIVERR